MIRAVLPACIACAMATLVAVSPALAQTAPPPPPSASIVPPPPPPGLSPELADASRLMREGQYAPALVKVDAALAENPRSPQARFMKAVIQTEQGQTNVALCRSRTTISLPSSLSEANTTQRARSWSSR
jgi:hypothetical protein